LLLLLLLLLLPLLFVLAFAVILSEGRSPKSKDPEQLTPPRPLEPFSQEPFSPEPFSLSTQTCLRFLQLRPAQSFIPKSIHDPELQAVHKSRKPTKKRIAPAVVLTAGAAVLLLA
jgi:hypothetical protein